MIASRTPCAWHFKGLRVGCALLLWWLAGAALAAAEAASGHARAGAVEAAEKSEPENPVPAAPAIPDHAALFQLPAYIEQIIDERIAHLARKDERLMALLQLVYNADQLNLQYANDVTRTPLEAIAARQGNCVALSFTFAAMARRAGLTVYFMESSDPGRWKQVGEHYALERHMSLYLPIRNEKTKGYHVDFQYAQPEKLRHKRMSDARAISDFYNNRAIESLMNHDLSLAHAFALEAIQADKTYDATWLNYGLIERHRGRLPEAIAAYHNALKHNRHNLSAYNNLVVAYRQLGDEAAAQTMLAKVTQHRLKNPFFLHSYGELQVREHRLDEAIGFFKKAIRRDKHIPQFYVSLAEAYYLNNNISAAIDTLEDGLKRTEDPALKTRLHNILIFLKTPPHTTGSMRWAGSR